MEGNFWRIVSGRRLGIRDEMGRELTLGSPESAISGQLGEPDERDQSSSDDDVEMKWLLDRYSEMYLAFTRSQTFFELGVAVTVNQLERVRCISFGLLGGKYVVPRVLGKIELVQGLTGAQVESGYGPPYKRRRSNVIPEKIWTNLYYVVGEDVLNVSFTNDRLDGVVLQAEYLRYLK